MNATDSGDSFLKWDSERVAKYVQSVLPENCQMEQLSARFVDHNIDGSLLPYLSNHHLKDMGIEPVRIRLILKKAFSALSTSPHGSLGSLGAFGGHSVASQVCIQALSLSSSLIQKVAGNKNIGDHEGLGKQIQDLERQLISPLARSQTLASTICADNMPRSAALGSLFESFIDDYVHEPLKDLPLTTPRNSEGIIDNPESASLAYSVLSPSNGDPDQFQLLDPAVDHTYLNRYSQGTIISTGTGRIIHQRLPGRPVPKIFTGSNGHTSDEHSSQEMEKIPSPFQHTAAPNFMSTGRRPPPRVLNPGTSNEPTAPALEYILGVKSAVELSADENVLGGSFRPHSGLSVSPHSQSAHLDSSHPSLAPTSGNRSQSLLPGSATTTSLDASRDRMASSGSNVTLPSGSLHNEPLKQLRASKDDSCLKVLQQAMKRHHITREDWSKYVLVICYGDKERILKLAEKPVVVFKELQELGKRPAIMLRQLAEEESDLESSKHESTLGGTTLMGDVPGGIL